LILAWRDCFWGRKIPWKIEQKFKQKKMRFSTKKITQNFDVFMAKFLYKNSKKPR